MKSCENCINAIRQGDNCEAVLFDPGPPEDVEAFLNQVECKQGVYRFSNGQEVVEASPGSERYAAMAKQCDSWDDRGEPLPAFSGTPPAMWIDRVMRR